MKNKIALNNNIQIEKASTQDIDAIVELHMEALKEEFSFSAASEFRSVNYEAKESVRDFFENTIYSDDFHLLIAHKNEVIGFALFLEHAPLAEIPKRVGYVNGIYVKPELRGQGIADSFIENAICWFRSRNVEILELSATVGSDRVNGFWKKWGFKPLEQTLFRKID